MKYAGGQDSASVNYSVTESSCLLYSMLRSLIEAFDTLSPKSYSRLCFDLRDCLRRDGFDSVNSSTSINGDACDYIFAQDPVVDTLVFPDVRLR